MAVPSKLPRRLISWPGLHLAFGVLAALALPALLGLALADLARRRWRLHLARVYAIALGAVTVELVLFWAATLASITTVNGRLVSTERWHILNVWLQNNWLGGQLAVARIAGGLRLEVDNPEITSQANAIVIGRHLSHADAIFPAVVYGKVAGHDLRYMLKEELQWPPAMDLVAGRMAHVWIDRAPGPDSPLLIEMRRAAADVDDHTVACIFPEGTFFTPVRLRRAVDRLAATRPDLAEEAAGLRHLLPPRPAGSLALLEGAPNADVVVLGHVGLEGFSSLRDIVRAVPLTDPVRVRLWRHPRSEIPDDPDGQVAWLVRRWIELDAWVTTQIERSTPGLSMTEVAS